LLRIIKEEIDYSPSVFTQLQMDRIYEKLLDYSYADNSLKREHVKSIKQRKLN
jgi:hypothetical protein